MCKGTILALVLCTGFRRWTTKLLRRGLGTRLGQDLDPGCRWKYRRLCSVPPFPEIPAPCLRGLVSIERFHVTSCVQNQCHSTEPPPGHFLRGREYPKEKLSPQSGFPRKIPPPPPPREQRLIKYNTNSLLSLAYMKLTHTSIIDLRLAAKNTESHHLVNTPSSCHKIICMC